MTSLRAAGTVGAVVVLHLSMLNSIAHAVGMVPETPVLVLDQALGEATMNVRNTDDHPALLHSTIEHIAQDAEDLLVLTPPVARVESGQVQQVRFILRTGQPLETERLKRVVFEGIKPVQGGGNAQVSLGVRQNIPVILRPANLPVERAPWKHLSWRVEAGRFRVSNPSPYVVRLAKSVNLIPGDMTVDLGRTYILPGETLELASPSTVSSHVRLFPATTYGFAVDSYDAPLVVR